MSELMEFDAGTIAIRTDEKDGRTVSGYAYRWGERSRAGVRETGGRREGFDKGAFAEAIAERAERPTPMLNTHASKGGITIGGIHWTEDDIGLRYDGRLLDTTAAREYAQQAEINNEVSMEVVLDGKSGRRDGDAVIHSRVQRIAALAGVPYPHTAAYAGATVAVRDDTGGQDVPEITELAERVDAIDAKIAAGPVPLTREETLALAKSAAEDVGRSFAERSLTVQPHAFAKYRNLGEMIQGFANGEIERDYIVQAVNLAERALDDIVTTSGVNAALLTGNLTVRNVAGIVSRGRPAINAFGGPAPIQDVGLSVTWPYFDGTLTDHLGAQSAQKAEIASNVLDIKLGTEALVTYAGGADVAYQLLRQGDPSILEIYGNILLTAYGVVTDAAFVTELESGSVTADTGAVGSLTFATLVGFIVDAAIAVQTATGQSAEFVLASTTAFTKAANLIAAASTALVTNGTLDLQGMSLAIGNLRLIHVPSMTAGKFIVSNRLAARWHEAGPFQAQAEDVAKLGRNFAYWGMGAGARYIPAGIIELYDVP